MLDQPGETAWFYIKLVNILVVLSYSGNLKYFTYFSQALLMRRVQVFVARFFIQSYKAPVTFTFGFSLASPTPRMRRVLEHQMLLAYQQLFVYHFEMLVFNI